VSDKLTKFDHYRDVRVGPCTQVCFVSDEIADQLMAAPSRPVTMRAQPGFMPGEVSLVFTVHDCESKGAA